MDPARDVRKTVAPGTDMSIQQEERLTRTFEAKDARGYPHTIEVWQFYTISRTLDGSKTESPGVKDYGRRPGSS